METNCHTADICVTSFPNRNCTSLAFLEDSIGSSSGWEQNCMSVTSSEAVRLTWKWTPARKSLKVTKELPTIWGFDKVVAVFLGLWFIYILLALIFFQVLSTLMVIHLRSNVVSSKTQNSWVEDAGRLNAVFSDLWSNVLPQNCVIQEALFDLFDLVSSSETFLWWWFDCLMLLRTLRVLSHSKQ